MSDHTTPTTDPARPEGARPGRRQLIVGGAAGLAALGLAPPSSAWATPAAAPTARMPRSLLHRWAADTWHSLDAMTVPATGLPADNIPESLAAGDRSGYTSPTNIGGYMW